MSKLKDLLMMAVEKEQFKIGDKTFQIIEVKEAKQPQPDYSHLVGKFVKCVNDINIFGVKQDSWYQVDHIGRRDFPIVIVGPGTLDSRSWTEDTFDLTNPQDTNPDEVKKILVPKEIVISEDVDGLNLHFGKNQALYVYKGADGYGVLSEADHEPIQCELIKCERAELKEGDVAYMNWDEEVDFSRLSSYRVIISDDDYCYVEDNANIRTRLGDVNRWNPGTPKHLYKLQPIQ